jgi:hypothetical protein
VVVLSVPASSAPAPSSASSTSSPASATATATAATPTIRSAKLFWGLDSDLAAFRSEVPFDGIVASDVTYIDELIVPLLTTIHALSGPHTYVAVAGRIRSEQAHLMFVMEAQNLGFEVDMKPLVPLTAAALAGSAAATASTAATNAPAFNSAAASTTTAAAAKVSTNSSPTVKPTVLSASAVVESDTDHFDTTTTYDFLCVLRKRK